MINVHSYESMGTFDGPGLRLVVFLQGCPFRCLYCANPDTIDVKGGTPTTPEEILQMAISQKAFFGKKGGITFSGGEPTLQAEALIPLFKELKANGIHICLDSNGGIWNEKVEELFNLTDLVLLDISMPYLDGLEIIRLVRQKFSAAELPILVITGAGSTEIHNTALQTGANDYLTKPIDPTEMSLRARNLLTIRTIYRENQTIQEQLESKVAARTARLDMLIENGLLLSRTQDRSALIRHTLFEGGAC